MFKPYQDLDEWSDDHLESELLNLHRDRMSGNISKELYREWYNIILDELLKRENKEDQQEAYDRAMKGI